MSLGLLNHFKRRELMAGKTKLSTKLIGGFVVVAFIASIIGYIGYYGVNQLNGHIEGIGRVRLPSIQSAQRIRFALQRIVTAQRTLLMPGLSLEDRQTQYKNFQDAREFEQEALKVYEPLPQTPEEAREWQSFKGVLADWARANDEAMKISRDFDATGILNPEELKLQLTGFRADHYLLEIKVADMALTGNMFDDGDDHTVCSFGRWMSTFNSTNRDIQRMMVEMREPHRRFHESVRTIRNAVQAGNNQEAARQFTEAMRPAAQQVFAVFDQLIAEAERAEALHARLEGLSMGKVREYQQKAFAHLHNVITINDEVANRESDQATTDGNRAVTMVFIVLIVGVIIALAFGIILSNTISTSLNRIIGSLTSGSEQLNSAAS
jgi:methyl-accepting chemotaxis protein